MDQRDRLLLYRLAFETDLTLEQHQELKALVKRLDQDYWDKLYKQLGVEPWLVLQVFTK